MKRFGLGVLLILTTSAGSSLGDEPMPQRDAPFTGLPWSEPSPANGLPNYEPLTAPCAPRTWGAVDYLFWWIKKGHTPPLVTTGPESDAFPGALDQPGTVVLFGGDDLDYGGFHGLRASIGAWLDGKPVRMIASS